jgi:hypothetical protein
MAVSLREIVTGSSSGSAASVDVGAGTESTDLLLAVGFTDFYSLGTFGPPSGGGWTLHATADLGTDNSKIQVWTKTAVGDHHPGADLRRGCWPGGAGVGGCRPG